MDKSYRIWSTGPENAYKDGVDVPWATQRCTGMSQEGKLNLETRKVEPTGVEHFCKMVSDHEGPCLCICDVTFNERVEV